MLLHRAHPLLQSRSCLPHLRRVKQSQRHCISLPLGQRSSLNGDQKSTFSVWKCRFFGKGSNEHYFSEIFADLFLAKGPDQSRWLMHDSLCTRIVMPLLPTIPAARPLQFLAGTTILESSSGLAHDRLSLKPAIDKHSIRVLLGGGLEAQSATRKVCNRRDQISIIILRV